MDQHLHGVGQLWLGGVAIGEASYHLVVRLDEDGEAYEVTGTVIATAASGAGYILQLDDGRQLGCTLSTRLGLPDFFTVEAEGLLVR
jgi:hypothetical protein